MRIVLREYQRQDFKTLADIVRKTWHYDKFCTPKTAERLAGVFLSSCLTNYTFSRVAVVEERPVGVILVKSEKEHRCTFSDRLRQICAVAALFSSREGRTVSKIFKNVNGIDRDLLKSCCREYQGEIALFAVDGDFRGKGIGKILFRSAQDYMKARNIQEFYLFTDTSCNYGFYEHQGMIRRRERKHTFDVYGQTAEMEFFVYDKCM